MIGLLILPFCGCGGGGGSQPSSFAGGGSPPSLFTQVWSDEFNGEAGTGVDRRNWLYDIGTGYPGGAPNWGTGEIEYMTDDLANVYQDGMGHLVIKPIRGGGTLDWTSGRIETQRSDFQAPSGGALAIEASIQQPDVSGAAAAGYWPAFWSLGAPFRGNYHNWPGIGEMDILEDINGHSSLFGTLHCGTVDPPNPCNEFTGLGSGETACPGCQTGFHTYRVELDDGTSPPEIRWYRDGIRYFTVRSDEVDEATWTNATDHGFFLILNVSIGGGFPDAFGGGPTEATVSGIPMLVDYVRVYVRR
jgi:beta-glucanase (GH16 family)